MSELTIRMHYLDCHGFVQESDEDYDLSNFAGFLPAVGDAILAPGVPQGLDRAEPANREMLTVVERVFNPRDLQHYVALVCKSRPANEGDRELLPPA
ncbi:hypothetical protein MKK50_18035 [Methylobacterium sp. J-043]|nr:hypothetical protein [Methylobacterium sp. J-043]